MSENHVSVLLPQCIEGLNIKDNGIYVDCTFGAGGHTSAILQANNSVKVIALDRDNNNKVFADQLAVKYPGRIFFANSLFSNVDEVVKSMGYDHVDGILYDFGVSSMQLDQRERGFSFRNEGDLSMEMGLNSIDAYKIVNTYKEEDLANIIYNNADEHQSRKIAHYIADYRIKKKIETTQELSDIVIKAVGMRFAKKIHPATKTFQAIRMEVNEELPEIRKSLNKAIDILKPEGRLCAISFHALEDRIVKQLFKDYGDVSKEKFNKYAKNSATVNSKLHIVSKKPIVANNDERKSNPRSRSAKLRIAMRTSLT